MVAALKLKLLHVPLVPILSVTSPSTPSRPRSHKGPVDLEKLIPPVPATKRAKGKKSTMSSPLKPRAAVNGKANVKAKTKTKTPTSKGKSLTKTPGKRKPPKNPVITHWPAPTLPHLDFKNPMKGQTHYIFYFSRRLDIDTAASVSHEISSALLLKRVTPHNIECRTGHKDLDGRTVPGMWTEVWITADAGWENFFEGEVREVIFQFCDVVNVGCQRREHHNTDEVLNELERQRGLGRNI